MPDGPLQKTLRNVLTLFCPLALDTLYNKTELSDFRGFQCDNDENAKSLEKKSYDIMQNMPLSMKLIYIL
jgi:hypothetical protein